MKKITNLLTNSQADEIDALLKKHDFNLNYEDVIDEDDISTLNKVEVIIKMSIAENDQQDYQDDLIKFIKHGFVDSYEIVDDI